MDEGTPFAVIQLYNRNRYYLRLHNLRPKYQCPDRRSPDYLQKKYLPEDNRSDHHCRWYPEKYRNPDQNHLLHSHRYLLYHKKYPCL